LKLAINTVTLFVIILLAIFLGNTAAGIWNAIDELEDRLDRFEIELELNKFRA